MTLSIYLMAFTAAAVRLFPITQTIFPSVFVKIYTCNSNTVFSATWHHTSTAQQAMTSTNYKG